MVFIADHLGEIGCRLQLISCDPHCIWIVDYEENEHISDLRFNCNRHRLCHLGASPKFSVNVQMRSLPACFQDDRSARRREKLNNPPLEPRLAAAGQINKSHMASRFWRFEEQTRILFSFRKGKATWCEKGIIVGVQKQSRNCYSIQILPRA
jgi:hypothetical protein